MLLGNILLKYTNKTIDRARLKIPHNDSAKTNHLIIGLVFRNTSIIVINIKAPDNIDKAVKCDNKKYINLMRFS
ncbi:MAG: hypothetical protein BWY74_04033 [Firmicutes bacterium ADurb.Bin419]|nr:MAG: hypothetical protein BWY74_04033 [Firmicutes bacterium ADurb.Bin419]